MENTKMKASSKYLRHGGMITVNFGKVGYDNPNRRTNLAEVEFGFCQLSGNPEPYFSITGGFWNCRHSDYVTCGASVHEEVQKFVNDPLLAELIKVGKKYHLMNESKVPRKVRDWVKATISELLEDYKRDHGE